MKHLSYMKYVIRHKWFVFWACCKFGILWRGLVHDWSKLTPTEWFPYVSVFGVKNKKSPRDKTGAYDPTKVSPEFNFAWLSHIHHNEHHWQHWVLMGDVDSEKILEMPEKYIKEMVCDWIGAGKAQKSITGPNGWYEKNGHKMKLHSKTRERVEEILNNL